MSESTNVGGISAEQLLSIVERVERLSEERKSLSDDIAEVYSEARGGGFDVKTIKKIVRLRAKDESDVREEDELLDLYKHALGMAHAHAREGEAE